MPKITTFVGVDTLKNLKEMGEKSSKSLSKIAAELIELGYKVKQLQDDKKTGGEGEKRTELELKHTEFLLRILAITSDILRCVHSEKSKYSEKNFDDILNSIRTSAQKYIEGYVGSDQ